MKLICALPAVCALWKTASAHVSPSTPSEGSVSELMTCGSFAGLQAAGSVCHHTISVMGHDMALTLASEAEYSLFAEMQPGPELQCLFLLCTGLRKGRFHTVFTPGSTVWPEHQISVKYAVRKLIANATVSYDAKRQYFLDLGDRFERHGNHEALAQLLLSVPRGFFPANVDLVSDFTSLSRQLTGMKSSLLPPLWNAFKSSHGLAMLTGILSVLDNAHILNQLLVPSSDSNLPILALEAVEESCSLPSVALPETEPCAFYSRNERLIQHVASLASPDATLVASAAIVASLCSMRAMLLNKIRHCPSVDVQHQEIDALLQLHKEHKQACTMNVPGLVCNVLTAAVYAKRNLLFEEVWRAHPPIHIANKLAQALIHNPEFASRFADDVVHMMPKLTLSEMLHFVRANVDMYRTADSIQRIKDLATRLVVTAEVLGGAALEAAVAGIDKRTLAPETVASLEDAIMAIIRGWAHPVALIHHFMCGLGDAKSRLCATTLGDEAFLRALLDERTSDRHFLALTELRIVPSPQFIHALLQEPTLLNPRRIPRLRDCLCTLPLMDSAVYALSGSQIIRLLDILHIPLHATSFTFEAYPEATDEWLASKAATFGQMAEFATEPGFMACLTYCTSVRIIVMNAEFAESGVMPPVPSRPSSCKRHRCDDDDNHPLPLFIIRALQPRTALDLQNPLHHQNFGLLQLWLLRHPDSFMAFAPRDVVRAFVLSRHACLWRDSNCGGGR